ncbi:hypothetical protein [Rubritalea tangerina]|uniref:DUF4174 domain-containing protein n=1 Tax=Rubritalea tangerina TaxID=430798 RepID=A0ABW4Z5S8_9BACT
MMINVRQQICIFLCILSTVQIAESDESYRLEFNSNKRTPEEIIKHGERGKTLLIFYQKNDPAINLIQEILIQAMKPVIGGTQRSIVFFEISTKKNEYLDFLKKHELSYLPVIVTGDSKKVLFSANIDKYKNHRELISGMAKEIERLTNN